MNHIIFTIASIVHFVIGTGYVIYAAESRFPVAISIVFGMLPAPFGLLTTRLATSGRYAYFTGACIFGTGLSVAIGVALKTMSINEPLVCMSFIDGFIIPGTLMGAKGLLSLNNQNDLSDKSVQVMP